MVHSEKISFQTRGFSDIINLTEKIHQIVMNSPIRDGIISISVIGSTASMTTIEYEPALVKDMHEALEKLWPEKMHTRYGSTWAMITVFHICAPVFSDLLSQFHYIREILSWERGSKLFVLTTIILRENDRFLYKLSVNKKNPGQSTGIYLRSFSRLFVLCNLQSSRQNDQFHGQLLRE